MLSMFEVLNPATLEVIAALTLPDEDEMDHTVERSKAAFETWPHHPVSGRQALLARIAAALETEKEPLARILTQEQGKPLHEARREVASATSVFGLYSKMGIETDVVRDDETLRVTVTGEPLGVCLLILPWNYPVGLLAWKLAPCLLAGNTAIIKPSLHAPLAVIECVRLINECLDENIVQVVGGNDDAGRYLVSHEGVDKVSLTGSRDTGREVLGAVSRHMPKVSLELGGNDAAVVLPDCDLKKRFESLFWGAFVNAGQICIAIKRLYVHESMADQLNEMFVKKLEDLKVGNGLDEGVKMGPLNNQKQLDRVNELVEDARHKGSNVLCGGERYSDQRSTGYFYKPTIVTDIDDTAPLVAEEQFGPALPILTYTEVDEAIARTNDTSYGLGSSIWTEDIERGQELAGRMQCGTVWLNAHMLLEYEAPFGGWKQSGIGRELGRRGLEEFQQSRSFIWNKS